MQFPPRAPTSPPARKKVLTATKRTSRTRRWGSVWPSSRSRAIIPKRYVVPRILFVCLTQVSFLIWLTIPFVQVKNPKTCSIHSGKAGGLLVRQAPLQRRRLRGQPAGQRCGGGGSGEDHPRGSGLGGHNGRPWSCVGLIFCEDGEFVSFCPLLAV